jgi:nudix-type nucleoside diphosphatase (YffH/AdpP family)
MPVTASALAIEDIREMQPVLETSPTNEQRRGISDDEQTAAVVLYNNHRKSVILVRRFRAPTVGKFQTGSGIPEAIAGVTRENESPEVAAVRIVKQVTGCKIGLPKLITQFFAFPGESAKSVHLYHAAVHLMGQLPSQTINNGDEERIQTVEMSFDELLRMIRSKRIEDPKLLIGAMWLEQELKTAAQKTLDHGGAKYALRNSKDKFIGFKTGSIGEVKDISIWVNSENEDMIMDRFIGRSISANIRYLGAAKDSAGNINEDVINNELTAEIGSRSPVRIGTVVKTSSGMLRATNGVKAIFHVATVRGAGAGRGVKADIDDLARCTTNILAKADQLNRTHRWLKALFRLKPCNSILIPMIGGGDGGLAIEEIIPRLFGAAVKYYQDNPATSLTHIYYLAYTAGQKAACERELKTLQEAGIVDRPERANQKDRPKRRSRSRASSSTAAPNG